MSNEREKHIVIVCPACGGGGSLATVALKQARELSKYFRRVTLVSDSLPDNVPREVEKGLINPQRFDYLRRFCHVPNEYSFVRSVKKLIEELHWSSKVDFIICHGHALGALSAKPLKNKYGIPFGIVTHGDIFERPEGTYDLRLTAFYKYVTPIAYRNADLVIALSPYMAEWAIKGGADPDAVKVIPNGIDPSDIGISSDEDLSQRPARSQQDPLSLLFVGRLSMEKGVDILVKACEILKHRSVNFTLDIIGKGPLEKDLVDLSNDSGLSNQIVFRGTIERSSLGEYYKKADIVCVPSVSDSLPTVVLEALVSGTPVIGSGIGGISFMLSNGENGILYGPNNSEKLAEAISSLGNKIEILKEFSIKGRKIALERFAWKTVGRSISDHIMPLIKE